MPQVYMPQITKGEDNVFALGGPCGMDNLEVAVLRLMQAHPGQKRKEVECHPLLVNVARAKALDLAVRGYEAHVDPDGHGANWLLRQAGYRLPDNYGQHDSANNVESAGWGGDGSAEDIWDAWMDSEYHRIHLLGLDATYQPQIRVGVGHVYHREARFGHYWVVLTAHPEGT